jgi:hypothetical protein
VNSGLSAATTMSASSGAAQTNSFLLGEGSLLTQGCLSCPSLIDSGWDHAIALEGPSSPACVGVNTDSECTVPPKLLTEQMVQVFGGHTHSCAIRKGTLTSRCWGPQSPMVEVRWCCRPLSLPPAHHGGALRTNEEPRDRSGSFTWHSARTTTAQCRETGGCGAGEKTCTR